ncbi:MAG: hypothetical protein EOM80_04710 [Erysipelotrichia bacterium]|nr:hypothetical protein [Erysipelotrichia bacterium]
MKKKIEQVFKNSSLTFWIVTIVVAISFLLINESKSPVAPPSTETENMPLEKGIETSAIDTGEAPKRISDTHDAEGKLLIPFSRVFKTGSVNDLFVDPRGRLWAATEDGISTLENELLTNYSINDGTFPFEQAECLTHDGKQMWIGTLFGLCCRNESGKFVRADSSDTLPSQIIYDLLWDGTTIWVGTQKGIAFKAPSGNFQTVDEHTTNGGLRNNWCKNIARFSNWLVAAHDKGISIWNTSFPASNPELWKNIDNARSAISRPVTGLVFDGKNLWISTAHGVLLLTTPIEKFFSEFVPNLVSYSKIHGLPTNRVNAMISHKGNIWIGTDEGLARIKNERIQLISPSSGNYTRNIRQFAASGDILWIGTDKGIQFINTAMVD